MNELVISHGGQRVTLAPGQAAMIGRGAGSALRVDDPRVSREHLRLSHSPQGWVLESVGQSGTFIAGQRVGQVLLAQTLDARLAALDGPVVRLEPALAQAPAPDPVAPAVQPGPATPLMPGAPGSDAAPTEAAAGGSLLGAVRMLIPIGAWLKSPVMRQWPRLLVAVLALIPVVLLIITPTAAIVQWSYPLYVAPVWAVAFWFLIQPGRLGRAELWMAAAIMVAEPILINVPLQIWYALLPSPTSLPAWIYTVGVGEEATKAVPVLIAAVLLLRMRGRKLDVRMWMFLATLSGLAFGVVEAAQIYVPQAINAIMHGYGGDILSFSERVFVDGFQHAMWAGIAGFFIGLGVNYRRQRALLWAFGLIVPAVLHGLNDNFAGDKLLWLFIQAFSVFLFLGYTASAAAIERQVRHTPIFRGESMLADPSRLAPPPAP